MAQPIDKGQICFIAEKYPTGAIEPNGAPVMKSRFAQLGRATMWPAEHPNGRPQIQLDLDSAPVASGQGPVRLFIFWDSEKAAAPQQEWGQQQYQQPQTQNQQPQYQQQHSPQHPGPSAGSPPGNYQYPRR
jgi:hypothetical protein